MKTHHLIAILLAGTAHCTFAAGEFAIIETDPPQELSRTLWKKGTGGGLPKISGGARAWASGLVVSGAGAIEVNSPFVPNDFPYVRLLAGEGTFGVLAAALPWIAEQVVTGKRSAVSAAGEILARVPPEGILSKEAYSGKGLRVEFSGVAQPGIGIEAVRVDAVPTAALAECDAASVAKIKSSGITVSPLKDGGCSFSTSGGDASFLWSGLQIPARDWNVVEFRLAAEGGGSATLVFDAAAGGSHEIPVPLAGDGKLHTYRVILMKHPGWSGTVGSVALRPSSKPVKGMLASVLLRFLPEPGAGNISSSIKVLARDPAGWPEMARRITNWRFVAGQSYRGNAAGFRNAIGGTFAENRIRWETDVPTWLFLEEDRKTMPKVDGKPSGAQAARLGYEAINNTAKILEKDNIPLAAAHFDGLLRRLLMPGSWPEAGRTTDGGFYEQTGGDMKEASRLTAEALCEFFVLARTEPGSKLKETEFWLQPNFHVWAWQFGALNFPRLFTRLPDSQNFREMMEVVARVDREYEAAGKYNGPSPLAGFSADWVFMNEQKLRLVSFEWFTTQVLGYRFNVINNGSLKGNLPAERSEESVAYLRQFRAEGGRPHGYTPYYWQDAWSDAPEYGSDGDAILPETQPHTFTWTVLESARACLYERDGTGTALKPAAQPHPK